ncbi:hypothetical protein ACJO2E_14550 [Marinobacter sp. M1N3S26]|uniref:hypothetical protein n=1 Tax=Marinobacter sp. M1N3S26 TaxID=3382299 RepID=UPI00387B628B
MTENRNEKDRLQQQIAAKRKELARYLGKAEPRNTMLMTTSIVCGALAAAFTAGPGFGGDGFVGQIKVSESLDLPLWQVLCLLASLMSMITVIANGLLKFNDLTGKISEARMNDAKLEGLDTMIELGQIDLGQATREYTECLSRIAHI